MEGIRSEKSPISSAQNNPLSVLSNGIILDPRTAANLQVETIKSYLRQSKAEGTQQKTLYLKHLLTDKINVPSNQMLSKAGKFYNYRSYGYETIYQQNKIQIADAISQFDENLIQQETASENDQNNLTPSDELAQNYTQKKKNFRSFSPNARRDESDGLFAKNQSYKVLNTTCLQFKQQKKEKINEIKQKYQQHPNSKLTSTFTRLDRNQLDEIDHKFDNDTTNMNYNPVFTYVLPSTLPHKFQPLPSTQRREDVVMQPDCIIRGNLCEYKIRNITQEMKKYSDKIMALLKKLEDLESKNEIKREKSHKEEASKLRDMLDIIQDKKRSIGEEILEAQKQFIKARTEYEELVQHNLDEQEFVNFNKNPDKIRPNQMNYQFKNIVGRGPLFPEQNVKDLTERLHNNYQDYQLKEKDTFYLNKTKGRGELFKVNKGPQLYDHYKQYENAHFQKTFNFVHMEKESQRVNYYTKHDFHAQQNDLAEKTLLDWNKIVEGQQKLSNFIKTPKYTNILRQTTREKPHPHQIRTIKVNTNFYKTNQIIPSNREISSARSYSPSNRKHQNNNDNQQNNSSFSQFMF